MKIDATVVVLGIILLGALFLLPSALNAVLKGINDLWRNFWAPFKQGNENNETLAGNIGLAITMNYVDGSSETFEPPPYSVMPFSISDFTSGKIIKSVDIKANVQITYNGELTKWDAMGTFTVYCDYPTKSQTKETIDTTTLTASGTTWGQGETKTALMTKNYDSAMLQSKFDPAAPSGSAGKISWTLDFSITATLDGVTSTKTSNAGKTYLNVYYYPPALQSLTVTLTSALNF